MTKKKKPEVQLTFKENVKEYWPLMLGAIVGVSIVIIALVPLLMARFEKGWWLVFTADVISTNDEQVIVDNITLEEGYRSARNADLLEAYRVDNGYAFDLGWYNTHVFSGFRYTVPLFYDGDIVAVAITPDNH